MKNTWIRTLIIFSFFVVLPTIYVGNQFFAPLSPTNRLLLIPTGTDYNTLKDSLKSNELLRNEFLFDLLCLKKDYHVIHPGRYLIDDQMDANSMVNALRIGAQTPLNVIFNNTSTLQDLAGKLASQVEADSLDLFNAFTNELFYSTYDFDQESMRKLFIPNTYEVYWTITPIEFLERMQKEYSRFWTDARLYKAKSLGLSPHEVSVLASIVHKETSKLDEQALVAGLYLNRLKKGMKLQSDPTVIYAIKERDGLEVSIKRVLNKDLKIESPYNTYRNKGLPPNPICIPEMSALLSVLNPKSHDYVYMCAKPDFSGYHNFTQSWTEHKRNAKRFQNALSAQGVMR